MQIDSKKELEKLLKATCEVFIMAVTKLTVEPMLSFITKVTAVRVASSISPGRRLREQVPKVRPHNHITWNYLFTCGHTMQAGICSYRPVMA